MFYYYVHNLHEQYNTAFDNSPHESFDNRIAKGLRRRGVLASIEFPIHANFEAIQLIRLLILLAEFSYATLDGKGYVLRYSP